ncbi:hypothetical protein C8R44DRAFT_875625 [Mycena epipterygia]|nr:hypothetical protein C8R44DRAFT_875625 [Mycena epipterygia]
MGLGPSISRRYDADASDLAPPPRRAPSPPAAPAAPIAVASKAGKGKTSADAVAVAPIATSAIGMTDMQAIIAAAVSAALGTKRAREDDDIDSGARNVRHHPTGVVDAPTSCTTGVASTSAATAVPNAPAAREVPDAPAARERDRRNDPARELIFGPVNWKVNINSEARTIIAEGMTARPNMRNFFTRRGPDAEHIIWET